MKLCSSLIAGAAAVMMCGAAQAQIILKASHQFHGGKGDPRDEFVQIIAKQAKAADVGVDVQIYPGATLFKPHEQWDALVNGQLDISSFPLDYAGGKIGAFNVALMPGLVRNHERALRLNASPFMQQVKAQIDKAGVVVLADGWLAGAVGSKKGCIRRPENIKGLKVRSAAPSFAAMWQQAGATIVSVPGNEVYNALQTGAADVTDTSTTGFVSLRLFEQVKCITAPGDNALWFMYEPVLMSMRSFIKLGKQQQDVLMQAGKKAEEFFSAASRKLDDEMATASKKNNVEVTTMSPAEFEAWIKVAQDSAYKRFADEVPGGKALIEEALAVQ